MSWRLAKSLITLRTQVGDERHQATKSDHNPNAAGVVQAIDITHDPAPGLDARKLAEILVASRDPRITAPTRRMANAIFRAGIR